MAEPGTDLGSLLLDLTCGPDGALFGVPGGQTLPLYKASQASDNRHVVVRDERNAATAADAWARLTGRVGVCDATVGPGVTNLVSGLAEAQASSIPVLAIVADTRRDAEHLRLGSVTSQSYAQTASLAPVTKWVGQVLDPASLGDIVDHALRVATTGRPGPVVVSVPEDIFLGPAAEKPLRVIDPEQRGYPRHRPRPDADRLAAAAELVRNATRPVVLAGGGVVWSGAASSLARLAERHGLPVVTTLNGKGGIDERHPLSAGVIGGFGTPRGNQVVAAADVVVAVGTKHSQLGTHGWRLPSPDQTLVQVDVEGSEIGRALPADVGMVADARAFLDDLDAELGGWTAEGADEWIVEMTVDDVPEPTDAVHPAMVVGLLDELLGPDDVVVSDASLSSGWIARYYRAKRSGPSVVCPRGLAGLGWSPGAALGARLARTEGKVVVLAGDGGYAYGLGEMETAVRYGLDITTVVLNNASFGWIRHVEQRKGQARSSDLGPIDFAAAAVALGGSGRRVQRSAEVGDALEAALAEDTPGLVEVLSSPEVSPIVGFGSVRSSAYE